MYVGAGGSNPNGHSCTQLVVRSTTVIAACSSSMVLRKRSSAYCRSNYGSLLEDLVDKAALVQFVDEPVIEKLLGVGILGFRLVFHIV